MTYNLLTPIYNLLTSITNPSKATYPQLVNFLYKFIQVLPIATKLNMIKFIIVTCKCYDNWLNV